MTAFEVLQRPGVSFTEHTDWVFACSAMRLTQDQLDQVYIGVSGFLLSAVLDPDTAIMQFYGDLPAARIPSHFMDHLRTFCAQKYASIPEAEPRPLLDLQLLDVNRFLFSSPSADYFNYRHQSAPCQNPITREMVTSAVDTTDLGEMLARHNDAGDAHPLSHVVVVEREAVAWLPWVQQHNRLPAIRMCTILDYVREKFKGNEALERSALTGAFKRVTVSDSLVATATFAINLPHPLYERNTFLIRGAIPQSQGRG